MTRRLEGARELDDVSAQTEARTLARRKTDRGREEVKNGEHNRSRGGNDGNLLQLGDLAGDDDHRYRDGETLQEILDSAGEELRGIETVHLFLYSGQGKKVAPPALKFKDIIHSML